MEIIILISFSDFVCIHHFIRLIFLAENSLLNVILKCKTELRGNEFKLYRYSFNVFNQKFIDKEMALFYVNDTYRSHLPYPICLMSLDSLLLP